MNIEKQAGQPYGAIFKQKMIAAKLSTADLAARLKISKHVVYGWHKRGVAARSSHTVAAILNCSATDISALDTSWPPAASSDIATAPIISWSAALQPLPPPRFNLGTAIGLPMNDMSPDCFSLLCHVTRYLSVKPSASTMLALFVDPAIQSDPLNVHGYIVHTPSMRIPALRHIERIGGEDFFVGVRPDYPTEPERFTGECRIIGAVIGVGLAPPTPAAFE